jgi:hypothetical protein
LPIKADHLRKARENESLAHKLDLALPSAANWSITILFYVAVHLVEAFFSQTSQHYKMHTNRVSAIGRDKQIRAIYVDFRELYTYSREARYEDKWFTPTDVGRIEPHLQAVKDVIEPLL